MFYRCTCTHEINDHPFHFSGQRFQFRFYFSCFFFMIRQTVSHEETERIMSYTIMPFYHSLNCTSFLRLQHIHIRTSQFYNYYLFFKKMLMLSCICTFHFMLFRTFKCNIFIEITKILVVSVVDELLVINLSPSSSSSF